MALKMPKLFGEKATLAAADTDIQIPTTQVRMNQQASQAYDPLASVSIMEQLRNASAAAATPRGLPMIGRMPVARQFRILGLLLTLFLILAALMVFLDARSANQHALSVTAATEMQTLAERMARSASTAAQGQVVALTPLGEARTALGKAIDTLQGGGNVRMTYIDGLQDPVALGTLADIKVRFDKASVAVDQSIQSAGAMTQAAKDGAAAPEAVVQAARTINAEADGIVSQAGVLAGQVDSNTATRAIMTATAIVFALLALICIFLLLKVSHTDARVHAQDSENENKRNQEAILRLLNEMGNLADGDLTVQASVTEDVTGAIADSINFTIEELRTLVKGINSATDQVTKATQETQAISNRLFEASQRQNKEIQHASASVLTMAQSISEVAQNAVQSARVAQAQLSAAEKGGNAVQNQIAGMNEIRSQIQETSKRIKRLGESSLEIGEIVELISDITEQTNVLALNAAIQAASAGEAGRGFTVVAEEVQRLAERSGEATKQIEAIVKTIQADTQDAVAAMDRSTVGVVEGAKLSDAAGQALTEIQRVSRELAELIGRISAQTQTQSASVADVTRGMQGILKITEETTEGTKQTNVSIGQLTKLAAELRSSVAGFKV